MPTIIGQEAPTDYRGNPRRISSEDLSLWHRFRAANLIHPTRLLFDVGVGDGKANDPSIPPEWRDMWLRETQRRIDVLVLEPDRQIIIELRHRALANALGRLLVYRTLYMQDPLTSTPLEEWLVTDTTDAELAKLFQGYGIKWLVV